MGGYQSDTQADNTGIVWKTVGEIDVSGDTPYVPAGKAGEVRVVTGFGSLNGSWPANADDLVYYKRDTEGSPADWLIIPHVPPVP
jgi:hypothetical protein